MIHNYFLTLIGEDTSVDIQTNSLQNSLTLLGTPINCSDNDQSGESSNIILWTFIHPNGKCKSENLPEYHNDFIQFLKNNHSYFVESGITKYSIEIYNYGSVDNPQEIIDFVEPSQIEDFPIEYTITKVFEDEAIYKLLELETNL